MRVGPLLQLEDGTGNVTRCAKARCAIRENFKGWFITLDAGGRSGRGCAGVGGASGIAVRCQVVNNTPGVEEVDATVARADWQRYDGVDEFPQVTAPGLLAEPVAATLPSTPIRLTVHLLRGGDTQSQARVGNLITGALVPVAAIGDCAGRIPGGL